MTTITAPRTVTLAALLRPYAGGLRFAVATRQEYATRAAMARLVVMSRTWDRLRGQG